MEHLLSAKQFKTLQTLHTLFETADFLREPWRKQIDPVAIARGKLMAIVKDEPSTRTRCSFEAAMKRLGGDVLLLDLDSQSSLAKGESLEDTVRTVSSYVDVLVLRLKTKGQIADLVNHSLVPVLSAGDGGSEHVTQALLDMYTLWRYWHKDVKKRKILFVGDLYYSRTIHSFIYLLGLDKSIEMHVLLGYNNLPQDCLNYIVEKQLAVKQINGPLSEVLQNQQYDAIYLTRKQVERHANQRNANIFPTLSSDQLVYLGPETLILHPLPRGAELPVEIDKDKRAVYFEQVKNGMYVRMALLFQLFTRED